MPEHRALNPQAFTDLEQTAAGYFGPGHFSYCRNYQPHTRKGGAMSAEPSRRIEMEGAWNIRDSGGYPTADGRRVRWRTFFRADSMHRLTADDQQTLLGLGLRTVIDLRQSQELADRPNVFADSGQVTYRHHNLVGDEPIPYSLVVGTPADKIFGSYSSWLEHRPRQVGQVLATLAEAEALPALYHCAGGKDRTGVISALLLRMAGVPEETIAADYGLTARYLWERWQAEPPEVEDGAELRDWRDYQREFCPPAGMLKVLGFLDSRYGGAEGFARSAGLSDLQIASLRESLVE